MTESRKSLPVQVSERSSLQFWSLCKQSIGKDLSTVSMPVTLNEPLSLLQRLSEPLYYGSLLEIGAKSFNQLEWLSAFVIASLSHNDQRIRKPFNPLLGETFTYSDSNIRVFVEQVGHHPPISAFYAENPTRDYIFTGSSSPKLKFNGKALCVIPRGKLTVTFPKLDSPISYSWTNPNVSLHNFVGSSLEFDYVGVVKIEASKPNSEFAYLYFTSGKTVEGFLYDSNSKITKFLYGNWSSFLCSVKSETLEKIFGFKLNAQGSNVPKHSSFECFSLPGSSLLWRAEPKPENSSKYYHFTHFTMSLNEIKEELHGPILKTDSRLRPDVRALENGNIQLATEEKNRLEIRQREFRKSFKKDKERNWWNPKWFTLQVNPISKEEEWSFIHTDFWDSPYSYNCDDNETPNIF